MTKLDEVRSKVKLLGNDIKPNIIIGWNIFEGVENDEQMKFLKKIGCERLQGYLFSKPITYEDLNEMISKGKLVLED